MINIIRQNEGNYDKIVFADYPDLYMFILYYEKIDPKVIQGINLSKENRNKEIINVINPKYHVMLDDCLNQGKTNILYTCLGTKVPHGAKIIDYTRYSDGLPAFIFLVFSPEYSDKTFSQNLPSRYEYQKLGEKQSVQTIPPL